MDLELPVLELLALGLFGLLQLPVYLKRVVFFEFHQVLRPLDELQLVGIDAHGLLMRGMLVPEDVGVHQRSDDCVAAGDVVDHGYDDGGDE